MPHSSATTKKYSDYSKDYEEKRQLFNRIAEERGLPDQINALLVLEMEARRFNHIPYITHEIIDILGSGGALAGLGLYPSLFHDIGEHYFDYLDHEKKTELENKRKCISTSLIETINLLGSPKDEIEALALTTLMSRINPSFMDLKNYNEFQQYTKKLENDYKQLAQQSLKIDINDIQQQLEEFYNSIEEQNQIILDYNQKITHCVNNLRQVADEKERKRLEMEKAENERKAKEIYFTRFKQNLGAGYQGLALIAHWTGHEKLAKQIAVIGSSTTTMIDYGWQLMGATTASMLLNPIVGIASVATTLINAFRKNKPDQSFEKTVQKALQMISRQVYELHKDMTKRFDRLEEIIDFVYIDFLNQFEKLREGQKNILVKLDEIASKFEKRFNEITQTQNYVSRKMDRYHQQLMSNLKDLRTDHIDELITGILGDIQTFGTSKEKYQEYLITLVNIAIRQSKYDSLTNGNTNIDDLQSIINMLRNEQESNLYKFPLIPTAAFDIGLLQRYAIKNLEIDTNFHNSNIVNPEIWFLSTSTLIQLLEKYQEGSIWLSLWPIANRLSQEEINNIKSVFAEGNDSCIFINAIIREELLRKIFSTYRANIIKLSKLIENKISEFEEKFNQEWKDKVETKRNHIAKLKAPPKIKVDERWKKHVMAICSDPKYSSVCANYPLLQGNVWIQVQKKDGNFILNTDTTGILQKIINFNVESYLEKREKKDFELYKNNLEVVLNNNKHHQIYLYSDQDYNKKFSTWIYPENSEKTNSNPITLILPLNEIKLSTNIFNVAELLEVGRIEATYEIISDQIMFVTVDFVNVASKARNKILNLNIPLKDEISNVYNLEERILYFWLGAAYAMPQDVISLLGYPTHPKHGIPTGLTYTSEFLFHEDHNYSSQVAKYFPQQPINIDEKLIENISKLIADALVKVRKKFNQSILIEIQKPEGELHKALLEIDASFYLLKAYLSLAFHNPFHMKNYLAYLYNPYIIKNQDDIINFLNNYSGQDYLQHNLTSSIAELDDFEKELYRKLKNDKIETFYLTKIANTLNKLANFVPKGTLINACESRGKKIETQPIEFPFDFSLAMSLKVPFFPPFPEFPIPPFPMPGKNKKKERPIPLPIPQLVHNSQEEIEQTCKDDQCNSNSAEQNQNCNGPAGCDQFKHDRIPVLFSLKTLDLKIKQTISDKAEPQYFEHTKNTLEPTYQSSINEQLPLLQWSLHYIGKWFPWNKERGLAYEEQANLYQFQDRLDDFSQKLQPFFRGLIGQSGIFNDKLNWIEFRIASMRNAIEEILKSNQATTAQLEEIMNHVERLEETLDSLSGHQTTLREWEQEKNTLLKQDKCLSVSYDSLNDVLKREVVALPKEDELDDERSFMFETVDSKVEKSSTFNFCSSQFWQPVSNHPQETPRLPRKEHHQQRLGKN